MTSSLIDARDVEIENRQIRHMLARQLDGRLSVVGLDHFADTGKLSKMSLNYKTKRRVVIHNQNVRHDLFSKIMFL